MSAGRVSRIFRYPVKSMGGESLEAVELSSNGLVGDRAWSLWDETQGAMTGGKRFPALMSCSARYLDAPPAEGSGAAEVALPDGSRVLTTASDAAERISSGLGRSVSLRSLRPAEDLEFYRRRGAPVEDFDAYLREVFARTPEEPLPDVSAFPPEVLQYETPPGTFFDAYPLLVMTEAALATLQERAVESRIDVRRFRPNLLIEAGDRESPFPEFGWVGKRLRVGGAEVSVAMECPRCVMTTHGFDDVPKDPNVMRALVRESGGNLGVYASVATPGPVAVGDTVELV